MSLLAELQRRQVLKVGATYLVVGWLAVQAASIAFPTFDAPPWALRVFIFVTLLGFPVALVMAWVLQVTADGVQVEGASAGSKRVYGAAALLTALAIAWYTFGQPSLRDDGSGDPRSIAVLPFVNMSGDPENEFFSDGISEQLLNELAQMEGLKVAARTSSFSFKGQNKEVPAIARELAVRMVLEGSVRKQGDRVRITAQLIDASNGFHVWSETYDRDLQDIFAIQDEIARAIAAQLEVKLGVAQTAPGANDTADLEAYEEYLKGSQLWAARGYENMKQARERFRAAVARDPTFAKAWAGLALTETLAPDWLGEPNAEAMPRSRDAAERALALDPLLPEAYAALGNTAAYEGRMDTAYALFERAIQIAPSYATAWHWYGYNLGMTGRIAEGIEKGKRAIELDPRSFIVRYDYLVTLYNGGAPYEHEVIAECGKILALRPDWLNCKLSLLSIALARRDFAQAGPLLIEMAAKRGPQAQALAEAMVEALEGKRDPKPVAAALLPLSDGLVDLDSQTPLDDANASLWYMAVGMPEMAIARLDRLARVRPQSARYSIIDPRFDSIRCRADYRAMVRLTPYLDGRAAEVCGPASRETGR